MAKNDRAPSGPLYAVTCYLDDGQIEVVKIEADGGDDAVAKVQKMRPGAVIRGVGPA